MQGRARPSLAALYNWRYEKLGDLPNVTRNPEYCTGNAGMAFDYQLIDVPDGEESAPMPYFYQVRHAEKWLQGLSCGAWASR